jgi:serine/threonine protein kinase
MHEDNGVKVKFIANKMATYIVNLLNLLQPNRIVPVDKEIDVITDKLNDEVVFTDEYECSTVGLTSNATSFNSIDEIDMYSYPFDPNKLKMMSILGSGSFGTVFLAEYDHGYNKETNIQIIKRYAVKKLAKKGVNKQQIKQIIDEKNILEQMSNTFVLKLYGTFQTTNELCFITEVIDCGDLFSAIYTGEKLAHKTCVFYSACILLALDYIHTKNVVFRDLKPENIMIDSQGYPRIIDFGLAKKLPYTKISEDGTVCKYTKCHSLCGTPEYVAPELILGNSYDYSVDIWALGVIIYEMITRRTPFVDDVNNKDVTNIFTNIVIASRQGILITEKIDKKAGSTDYARNLITQLLSGDEKKRIPSKNNTIDLIKHPYFSSESINADDLYNRKVEAPQLQEVFIGRDIETAKEVEEYNGDEDIFSEF